MDKTAKRRRVLVVEDAEDLRDFYAILLREEGYDVAMAGNGAEALGKLPWKPDVILLDLMMPVMNGYEFYARLRDGASPCPPVIIVSAVPPALTRLPGVRACLPKPFDFPQLLRRVAAAAA